MPDERRGLQLESVEQSVEPAHSGLAVPMDRQIDRVAQADARPVGSDHPDSVEGFHQRKEEPSRVTGPVEEDDRWPGALLEQVNTATCAMTHVAVTHRGAYQHALVDPPDLGGMDSRRLAAGADARSGLDPHDG